MCYSRYSFSGLQLAGDAVRGVFTTALECIRRVVTVTDAEQFVVWSHDLTLSITQNAFELGYKTVKQFTLLDYACQNFLHLL